jgi:hypothetical protein
VKSRSLTDVVNTIKETLKREGYKVAGPTRSGTCLELAVDAKDSTFFIYVFKGEVKDYVVVKVTTEPGDCERTLLNPRGLYVIDNDVEKLVSRLLNKVDLLKRIRVKAMP